jgi:hypothetical protein
MRQAKNSIYNKHKKLNLMGKVPAKNSIAKEEANELVLTPGGWRPKNKVSYIEPGHHISGAGGSLKKIHTKTGKVVKDFGIMSRGQSLRDKKVFSGSEPLKKMTGDDIVPAPATGWIVDSGWTNDSGTPISYFSTNWIVPPAPATSNGQTIFLFNGITTAPQDFILQPVLQWGSSQAGGGSFWSITNWFVGSDGTAMFGPLITVNTGDNLQGIMELTAQAGANFSYRSSFAGFPTTDLLVTDIDELTWANETLECYGLTQFSDYPDTAMTAFTAIEIKVGTNEAVINWTAENRVTDNGQNCDIVSNASPGGAVYLYYKNIAQALYFIVDKSTFGKDEVQDMPSYPEAFWLELEGFTIQQVGTLTPALSGAFKTFSGISIAPSSSGIEYQLPGDQFTPQRIRFPFDINFGASSLASFPTTGNPPLQEVLNAAITVDGRAFNASTVFELVAGADPYFINVNPAEDNAFYLSQDLRIFTATPGMDNTPVSGGPVFSSDNTAGAFSYIQNLLNHLNSNYSNPGGTDPFSSVVPNQSGALSNDSSVTPFTFDFSGFIPTIHANYNFAIARVRLRGTAGPAGAASDVKVFFRLWSTQTADTDFQPSTTYLSNLDGSGLPDSPRVAPGEHTIPFFATGNLSANTDYATGGINRRSVEIPSGQHSVWAYFGCFLNVYDSGNIIDGQQIQHWLNGTHHCIVAQIAFDDAPIINSNGVTMTPENSDKLAQRNLQVTHSDNPGGAETHRVPQTFDMRPSEPVNTSPGDLLDYPDELMIDWGNTPEGSMANIYWPRVNASEVIALATKLYSAHSLTAADPNTIRCKTTKGITYVPIVTGSGENFAGLFTVDLPTTVVSGQEFNIIVRRITTRRNKEIVIAGPPERDAIVIVKGHRLKNWRYVTGTFQVKIPVTTKEVMLFPEENTLAIFKWRLQSMSPANRWYPVLQRYISYISARVDGLGGNAAGIKPSLQGVPVNPKEQQDEQCQYSGKICQIIYDCFGDFEGFILCSCCSKNHFFKSREKGIAEIALRACKDRLLVSVCVDEKNHSKICRIIVRC